MKKDILRRELLMTEEEGLAWHALKAEKGPLYPGYPGYDPFLNWLKDQFAGYGCVDFREHHWTHNTYFVDDFPKRKPGTMELLVDGKEFPVGTSVQLSAPTDEKGITAPLVWYDIDQGEPEDGAFEGKIVVMGEPPMPSPPFSDNFLQSYVVTDTNFRSDPEPPAPMFEIVDPALNNSWATRWSFGSWSAKQVPWAMKGGAVGCIVASELPMGGLYGLYDRQSVHGPTTLILDRTQKDAIIGAAKSGKSAVMKLDARFFDADAWNFICYLPGAQYGTEKDEEIAINCHIDAMSLTQDNGALGILGIVRYFSKLRQDERAKTLLICVDSRHFIEGFEHGNAAHDPYVVWPEIKKPITACLGLEHMGEMEGAYDYEKNEMIPTGRPEFSFMVTDDNDFCAHLLIRAAINSGLERADIKIDGRPGLHGAYKGLVRAIQAKAHRLGVCVMGEAGNWPGAHTQKYSTLSYFGAKKFRDEVALWTEVTSALMETDSRVYDIAWSDLNTAIRKAAGDGIITETAKEGLLMGVASLFRDAEAGDFDVAAWRLEHEIVAAAEDLGLETVVKASKMTAEMLRKAP